MFKRAVPFVAIGVGLAAGRWVGLPAWLSINDGLLAFFGLLAAALFQVIPITANFLQADDLTPEEARRLCGALERQQKFWIGMLAATVLAFTTVVLASLAKDWLVVDLYKVGRVDLSPGASFLIGSSVCFLLLRMVSVLNGVLSLQRLRSALVLSAAKRRAAAKAEKIQQELSPARSIVPSDYGSIQAPPAAH
ncbi:hypothetical protein D3C71_318420 [compost metagenome]